MKFFLVSASSVKGAVLAVSLWLLAIGIAMTVAPSLSEVTTGDQEEFLPSKAESVEALAVRAAKFPSEDGIPALVVFDAKQTGDDLRIAIERFVSAVRSSGAPSAVSSTFSPFDSFAANANLTSVDGKTSMVIVTIRGNPSDDAFLEAVEWLTTEANKAGATVDVQVAVTGPAGIFRDAIKVFKSIDVKVTVITVTLVLVLLLVIYRSPVLAIAPPIVIGTALLLAQNLAALLAQQFGLALNQQVTSIMSILVFGAGTNYALFIFSRYTEELPNCIDKWSAMRSAMSSVGPSIAGSAGTTIVAMSALTFASFGSFKSLGPMLAMAVVVVLFSGLFIIPAVITLLGRWAFWPREFVVPEDRTGQLIAVTLALLLLPLFAVSIGFLLLGKALNRMKFLVRANEGNNDGLWERAGTIVASRPRLIFSITMLGIVIATIPAWSITPSFNFLDSFPDDAESKVGYKLLASAFPPGQLAPTEILIQSTRGTINESYDLIAQLSSNLAAVEGVASVTGPTRPAGKLVTIKDSASQGGGRYISADGTTARVELILSEDPYSASALEMVATIRNIASESNLQASGNYKILVGGSTAVQTDTKASIDRDISWLAPVSLLGIFLVLIVLLRSLVAPLYLVFTVIVSFGATFGISVFVFQQILNHSGVAYSTGVWMFIFLVAFGADYNIFVMSRIREATSEQGLKKGIATAVGRTGGVITSAGIILAGTFAVLTTLPLRDLFQLGFAVMLGVLIDTFVVRAFLVPSITMMFGRWSWWPGQLKASAEKRR